MVYLEKNGWLPLKNAMPQNFRSVNLNCSLKAWSDALSETTVDSFYEMLKSLIKNGNIVPDSINNLDKSGLITNPIRKKVFFFYWDNNYTFEKQIMDTITK